MKETVLLYNVTDRDRLWKIRQALIPLGFRLKMVAREDYGRPVGALAGVRGLEETEEEPQTGSFDDEMLVMAGFTSGQIDALIRALRKTGVGRIDSKAVLTPVNQTWDSVRLYREIRREHEAMNGIGEEQAGEV